MWFISFFGFVVKGLCGLLTALGHLSVEGAGLASVGYVRTFVWLIGRERINGDASCDDGYQ
jgi:hypothetical protein